MLIEGSGKLIQMDFEHSMRMAAGIGWLRSSSNKHLCLNNFFALFYMWQGAQKSFAMPCSKTFIRFDVVYGLRRPR